MFHGEIECSNSAQGRSKSSGGSDALAAVHRQQSVIGGNSSGGTHMHQSESHVQFVGHGHPTPHSQAQFVVFHSHPSSSEQAGSGGGPKQVFVCAQKTFGGSQSGVSVTQRHSGGPFHVCPGGQLGLSHRKSQWFGDQIQFSSTVHGGVTKSTHVRVGAQHSLPRSWQLVVVQLQAVLT